MRKYCIECCKKHLGSAAVLEDEVLHGYPQYELYVLGHLDQAASEIQRLNMELSNVIREHRIHWLEDHSWDIPYEALWTQLDVMGNLPEDMARSLNVSSDAKAGLSDEDGLIEVSGDTRIELSDSTEKLKEPPIELLKLRGRQLDSGLVYDPSPLNVFEKRDTKAIPDAGGQDC